MITVSYNAYCAISKEGDNDIWTVRPRGVVPLFPNRCRSYRECSSWGHFFTWNNTHRSRFHDRDPQFASRILGAMTQSCHIGTRDIWSRVIRGPYCILMAQCKTYLASEQCIHNLDSLWPSDAIWCCRAWPILLQVIQWNLSIMTTKWDTSLPSGWMNEWIFISQKFSD